MRRRFALLLALVLAVGCVRTTDPASQLVTSPAGAVAAASRHATAAGAQVLAEGGNAADAAVTAAFVLAVTEPSMSGLGGRASIVVRTPGGRIEGIDGLNQVPAGWRPGGEPGYERAAVPGVPAALSTLLADHGTWSLERVLQPAIRLADEGFPLEEDEAARFAAAAEDLRLHPGSAACYLRPDGSPYEAGDRFAQPDLAATLRTMAEEGIDAFYHGRIAERIAEDMRERGGFITREDLADYRALPAIQVRGTYRGVGLVSNFRPASGHAVIQALQMMDTFDPADFEGPAEWAAVTAGAMRIAISDRRRTFGDEDTSALQLTSTAWARERAAGIQLPGEEEEPPAAVIPAGEHTLFEPDEDHTTHLSVMDASGYAVALTQSLGPSMGTRLVTPGLGFLYATRLGSEPGSRPSSTISPTLLLDPEGTPLLAVGCAGDDRIITAIVQVISSLADRGRTLEEAVAAPRVHPGGGRRLLVELGDPIAWEDEHLARLATFGFDLEPTPSSAFGRVHAVRYDPISRIFTGVAEPRWDGGAAAPR